MRKQPIVNCERGAPMGRPSCVPPPPGTRCRAELVAMDKHDPAYDSGGAYWGTGAPLYELFHDEGSAYVRAIGPQDAIEQGKLTWPGVTFASEKIVRNKNRRDVNELKRDMRTTEGPKPYSDAVVSWLFDVCVILLRRGVQYPGYDPGCGEPECLMEAWLDDSSTEALYHFADILSKYAEELEKQEENECRTNATNVRPIG